jgi:4-amino-4-deoxy-L-arabinose transferase-like glycosyltransferase
LVGWQIALGCLVAPSLYLALRHLHPQGAFLGALFVALDPQTAYLGQLVATEALYIALLGLGMAVFFWALSRPLPWYHWVGVGVFLALGCFARPVGMLLIVPYVFFQLAQTRRLRGALALMAGYALVFLCLSGLHWWRFDFFAPNNNSGLYLGTRLFGVGGLYDPANGPESQYIYDLAQGCNLDLTDQADAEGLVMTRRLRGCLYMAGMDLEEISQTYQRVYAEATRARPLIFLQTMFQQARRYLWMTSDPIDLAGAEAFIADCEAPRESWYDAGHLFCPTLPSPLAPLRPLFFYALLAFSGLTRALNFALAAWVFRRASPPLRWLLLFCLGFYAYHVVVTAFAGTILSRYITVTNVYLLIALGFSLALLYRPAPSQNTGGRPLKDRPPYRT